MADPRTVPAPVPPQGRTSYLGADMRDTGRILQQSPAALDFVRPVAPVLSDASALPRGRAP